MSDIIKTVLLCALPASGKSEVRTYLDSLSPEECSEHFHMGETVQLDDYPYVHFMRCVDEELAKMDQKGVFFKSLDKNFADPYNWGTLIALLNMDYRDLIEKPPLNPPSPARWLFWRIDMARKAICADTLMDKLDHKIVNELADRLEGEAGKIVKDKAAGIPDTLEGKTVVIEFARGGKDGTVMPLMDPFGYQYSLRILSNEILEDAAILYIWVTPEESRRKNTERADPNDPGSILNHGVPMYVMMNDYGCDDIDHLVEKSGEPNSVHVHPRGKHFSLPIGRVDNRNDLTTFVRAGEANWSDEDKTALRNELNKAFGGLWEQYKK